MLASEMASPLVNITMWLWSMLEP